MGEGWVGVNVNEARSLSGDSTPPQPLPIKGRGFQLNVDTAYVRAA